MMSKGVEVREGVCGVPHQVSRVREDGCAISALCPADLGEALELGKGWERWEFGPKEVHVRPLNDPSKVHRT